MKQFFRPIKLSGLLCAVIAAAGCVSLLPETAPPKPRYHIEAPSLEPSDVEAVDWSLIIDDPRTTRVYDSVRVAVSSAPGKIEYLAGAEWADRAPRLFLTALVQTFEDSGRILSVGERAALPIADFALQTDIRKLEFATRENGQVEVSIYARLTDSRSRVLAAKKFSVTQNAESDKADAIITAFDQAFDTLITDMVAWTFEQGENAMADRNS